MALNEFLAGDMFTIADCAAALGLFYALAIHPWEEGTHAQPTRYYRALAQRPFFAKVIADARPYRHLFPLPWPTDFDRYHKCSEARPLPGGKLIKLEPALSPRALARTAAGTRERGSWIAVADKGRRVMHRVDVGDGDVRGCCRRPARVRAVRHRSTRVRLQPRDLVRTALQGLSRRARTCRRYERPLVAAPGVADVDVVAGASSSG